MAATRYALLAFALVAGALAGDNDNDNDDYSGTFYDILTAGAIPDDNSYETMEANTEIIEKLMKDLAQYDTLVINEGTWFVNGGLRAHEISDVVIDVQGTLAFDANRTYWPVGKEEDEIEDAIMVLESTNITFTSSNGQGVIDGYGHSWWGVENYATYGELRPRLLRMMRVANVVIENIFFKDSPYWHIDINDAANITIRHVKIEAKVDADAVDHSGAEMEAFNTDGIDIAATNVHIHDCDIWVQDDCIAIKDVWDEELERERKEQEEQEQEEKENGNGNANANENNNGDDENEERESTIMYSPCSSNVLVERVRASGVGLTIGSIGGTPEGTCVNNITFRDSVMPNTYRGIYMKSGNILEGTTANITDVTYKNITIINPESWPIWIGPAQQLGSTCSMTWPAEHNSHCYTPAGMTWENIVLEDIHVVGSQVSPGAIIGNSSNPMVNVEFKNVFIDSPAREPFGSAYYACYGVDGLSTTSSGITYPTPECFNNGSQCTSQYRNVVVYPEDMECEDDDEAISQLTNNVVESCEEAIALVGSVVCYDPSSNYNDLARKYCKASCNMCDARARRSGSGTTKCVQTLSYTCSSDDTCSPPSSSRTNHAALNTGHLFMMFIAVLCVAVAFMFAIRVVNGSKSAYMPIENSATTGLLAASRV